MVTRVLISLAFVFATWLHAAPVSAAEPSPGSSEALAKDMFERGIRHVENGELEEARRLFEHAEALYPRTSTLLNLAIVEAKLGHFDSALRTLDRLDVTADLAREPQQLVRAKELRQEILRMFGVVRISVLPDAATVRIDGQLEPPPFDYVRLPPGSHEVEVSSPGFQTKRFPIQVQTGGRLDLELMLHPAEADPSQAEGLSAPAAATASTCPSALQRSEDARKASLRKWERVTWFALGAVGIAALSSGLTLAVTH